jgi:hypothetical protein
MRLFALFALALVGCAPLVRYSECETGGPPCPTGTVCQQVSGQHAVCTVVCDYELIDDVPQFLTTCEGSGARCFLGPYPSTSNTDAYFCRQPCDAARQCPAGLSCMMGEVAVPSLRRATSKR